uniref:Uncharacterized protein n=1 Tax=Entomoneis paludosa TaxID=265537 RepID=A0A7S2V9K3_9STRA
MVIQVDPSTPHPTKPKDTGDASSVNSDTNSHEINDRSSFANAVTPIARGRSIVETGTAPEVGLPDIHQNNNASDTGQNDQGHATNAIVVGLSVNTRRGSLGSGLETIVEATTPDASNVAQQRPSRKEKEINGDDLLGELHDHAEGLSNMGRPQTLESTESFRLPEMPEDNEAATAPRGVEVNPLGNTDETSAGDSTPVHLECAGGGSNPDPRTNEDLEGPRVREVFRDAGELNIDDALAGPSWVGPESVPVAFDENIARPKRIEFSSSVGSVSSTISASSTVRNTPGFATPVVSMDPVSRPAKNRHSIGPTARDESVRSVHSSTHSVQSTSAHSVRSRNSKLLETQDSFAETLASKLESASTEEVGSRWIKKSKVETFDPSESVFAFMSDEQDSPDISEPGSPPELNYDDDSSFDSSENEREIREAVQQTASVWDMIPRPKGEEETKPKDSSKPSFVVLPDSDDSNSVTTEYGKEAVGMYAAASAPHVSSEMSVVSASTAGKSGKRRRGVSRRLSVDFGGSRSKGGKKKSMYRYDPQSGFRATNQMDEGSLFEDDDISGVFSIAGGSVIDSRTTKTRSQNKTSSLTVSAMTKKQRTALVEQEARARERGKLAKKDNKKSMSLDAFFSSNNKQEKLLGGSDPSESSSGESGGLVPEKTADYGDSAVKQNKTDSKLKPELSLSENTAPEGQPPDRSEICETEVKAEELQHSHVDALKDTHNESMPETKDVNVLNMQKTEVEASLAQVDSMDTDDDEEERFEECLRDFCSPVTITSPIVPPAKNQGQDAEGTSRWKQLHARWKHAETMRAITSRYPTRQYLLGLGHMKNTEEESVESMSSAFPNKPLELNLLENGDADDKRWKNRDGFHPHHGEGTLPIASGFLFQLGNSPATTITTNLKHKVEGEVDKTDALLEKANSLKSDLESVLQSILEFASSQNTKGRPADFSCSVTVKDRDAIKRKATQKYHDDVLCVKDVLRGQVMFPDESSLVCGLVKLEQMCREPQKLGESDDKIILKVERAKNCFQRDESGALVKSNLPTGYRHFLLTVSLGGFLAEIQMHLRPLFEVLCEDGCALHLRLTYGTGSIVPSGSEVLFTGLIERVVGEAPSSAKTRDSKVKLPIEKHNQIDGENGVTVLSSYWSQDATFEPMPPKGELQDAIRLMISEGVNSVRENPRDISNLHCLLDLLSDVLSHQSYDPTKIEKVDREYIEFFRSTLCSCLDLFDQTSASSMFGWLSVDESKPLDRLSERPLELLHELGCLHAKFGQWHEAEEIFRSLLSRCENHLPLYHPRVLSAMLDVAIAARKNKSMNTANELLAQTSDRLSCYLAEMEKTHLVHQGQSADALHPGGTITQQDFGREALQLMDSYSSLFQCLLKRRLVGIVGAANDVVLLHYCWVGDVQAVLANCVKVSESFVSDEPESLSRNSKHYWRLAFAHYRIAFKGYSTSDREQKPLVALACAAYGTARSLRELGDSGKALQILSIVMGTLLPESTKLTNQPEEPSPARQSSHPTFLPHVVSSRLVEAMETESQRFVVASYCLWLMAVLTVDTQPNEEGRVRSLKLLHKASVALQYALKILHPSSEDSRASCIELLRKIEDEAKSILRPVRSAAPTRIPSRPMGMIPGGMRGGVYQGVR